MRAGRVLVDRTVVSAAGRIADILPSSDGAPGPGIDGHGLYLCPGLIDAHAHLFLDGGASPVAAYLASDDRARFAVARRNAAAALAAGVTTVRDCGAPPLVFELRGEVNRSGIPGPHVVSCGAPLTRVGGHCHFFGGEVATVEDVRRLVEGQIGRGARCVKLMASGGGLTPGTTPHAAELPLELMRAAVDAARAHGVPVTAHCHATESIARAIEAGVDMIEHASFVEAPGRYRYDAALAARIRDAGIAVGPTVSGALRTAARYRAAGGAHNPDDVAALERLEGRPVNAGSLHRLGVPIVGGTDSGVTDTPSDSLVDEVSAYTTIGMTRAEALRTVTSGAADRLRLGPVGEVRVGYRADLLLLAADPLADLGALRRPLAVFKDGALVHVRSELARTT